MMKPKARDARPRRLAVSRGTPALSHGACGDGLGWCGVGVLVDVREVILDGLADGQSLRAICRSDEMPNIATVMRWLAADPEWRAQYAHAREIGDDAMAEDIQTIADDEDLDPNDKRVRIDTRKWLMAKRQPKKYGDKIETVHSGSVEVVTKEQRDAAVAAATRADR